MDSGGGREEAPLLHRWFVGPRSDNHARVSPNGGLEPVGELAQSQAKYCQATGYEGQQGRCRLRRHAATGGRECRDTLRAWRRRQTDDHRLGAGRGGPGAGAQILGSSAESRGRQALTGNRTRAVGTGAPGRCAIRPDAPDMRARSRLPRCTVRAGSGPRRATVGAAGLAIGPTRRSRAAGLPPGLAGGPTCGPRAAGLAGGPARHPRAAGRATRLADSPARYPRAADSGLALLLIGIDVATVWLWCRGVCVRGCRRGIRDSCQPDSRGQECSESDLFEIHGTPPTC